MTSRPARSPPFTCPTRWSARCTACGSRAGSCRSTPRGGRTRGKTMKIRTALAAAAAVLMLAGPVMAKQPHYSKTYGEDRAEIEDLMSRYLFAIDYNDWDSYVEPFATDGVLEFASGTSKGRDEIRKNVTNFAAGIGKFYHTEDGKPAKLRHVVLQSMIRIEGNRAWGRALWLA